MKRFEVKVAREGRWWMVEVPELDGLTQARRLSEVAQMAREWIALNEELSIAEVEVDVVAVNVDGLDVGEASELVAQLREESKIIDGLISHLTRETAVSLNAAQVPMRDISEVLGVSHQRVAQLVAAGVAEHGHEVVSGSFAKRTAVRAIYPSADIAQRLERQVQAARRLADDMARMQTRAGIAQRKAEVAAKKQEAQTRAARRAAKVNLEAARKSQKAADAARRALKQADTTRRAGGRK